MSTNNHKNKLLLSPTKYPGVNFLVFEKRFELLSDEDKRKYEVKAKITPVEQRNAGTKKSVRLSRSKRRLVSCQSTLNV